MQRCGYSLEPSPNTTIEATFTPDGQYVVSGIQFGSYVLLSCTKKPLNCDMQNEQA